MFDFNLQEVSSKLDLDYELNRAVEYETQHGSECSYPYLIMSKETYKLFKIFSKNYDKESNLWGYTGGQLFVPEHYSVAIDKSIYLGGIVIL